MIITCQLVITILLCEPCRTQPDGCTLFSELLHVASCVVSAKWPPLLRPCSLPSARGVATEAYIIKDCSFHLAYSTYSLAGERGRERERERERDGDGGR